VIQLPRLLDSYQDNIITHAAIQTQYGSPSGRESSSSHKRFQNEIQIDHGGIAYNYPWFFSGARVGTPVCLTVASNSSFTAYKQVSLDSLFVSHPFKGISPENLPASK
jgi:hypothetical protein